MLDCNFLQNLIAFLFRNFFGNEMFIKGKPKDKKINSITIINERYNYLKQYKRNE